MSDEVQIRQLRLQVERFIDADLLLLEDGQRLLAALDVALAEVIAASVAGAKTVALLHRAEMWIGGGVLSGGEGQPPLETTPSRVADLPNDGGTDR